MKEKPKTITIKDKPPTYKELKKMVGGYLEFAYDDGDIQIICNEEGKLKGLPMNWEATKKWYDLLHTVHSDYLAGDIVMLMGKARLK